MSKPIKVTVEERASERISYIKYLESAHKISKDVVRVLLTNKAYLDKVVWETVSSLYEASKFERLNAYVDGLLRNNSNLKKLFDEQDSQKHSANKFTNY